MRVRSSLSLAVLLFAFLGSACSDDASEAPDAPPGTNDVDAGTDADDGSDADNGADGDTDADANPNPAIVVEDSFVRVPLHGSVEVKIAVTRSGDANGEIQLSIQGDMPKGVSLSATELTIPAGESAAVVTFSSNDEVEALGVESTLQISAKSGDLSDEATLKIQVAALVTSLADDGLGSLRDMVESAPLLAENPTIGFAEAVFPESGGPHVIELESPIAIAKSLSIEAPTTASDEPFIVIDAKETGRVLDIRFAADDEDKEVAISGLQIQGGNSDENGGCIYSEEAVLTLEKVVVAQCQGKRGGGIEAIGAGEVRIENSTFRENVSSEHGGGIAIFSPHSIRDSLFEANESKATGGGIFVNGDGEVKDSRFIGNHAKDLGGAMRVHGNASRMVTIENGHFEGNYSHSAGAISAVSAVTIKGSTFHKNEARDERGGAIVKHGGSTTLTIQLTTFTENKAVKYGGAIAANNDAKVDITDCRFQKNTAEDGGGLYASDTSDDADTRITIISSVFEEQTVTNSGGAIYVDQGQLRLAKSTLSENRAYAGGGLYYSGTKNPSFIGFSTIANNSAAYGGGISVNGSSEMDFFIEYSTIADNLASTEGGGIEADFRLPAVLNLRGSIIATNRVAAGGTGPDFFVDTGTPIGSILSKGYNLLGSLAGTDRTCAANFTATDECEVEAKLGALANNGSAMKTILPDGDSPAKNAIPKASCSESDGETIWANWPGALATFLAYDQRELPRPSGDHCDIGAVETQ